MAIGDGTTAVGNLIFYPLFYVASNATPSSIAATAAAGVSTEYSRADHTHNITTATITPLLGEAATKNVTTTINSTSEDLPTAKAVNSAITSAAASVSAAIPSASTTTPIMDGTATIGTAST